MKNESRDIVVNVWGSPFDGGWHAKHRCLVEPSGDVLVWDGIAGHYTRCHNLGDHAARICAEARRGTKVVNLSLPRVGSPASHH